MLLLYLSLGSDETITVSFGKLFLKHYHVSGAVQNSLPRDVRGISIFVKGGGGLGVRGLFLVFLLYRFKKVKILKGRDPDTCTSASD